MVSYHIEKLKKPNSWRIVIENRNSSGERKRIYKTVNGLKGEAKTEAAKMVAEIESGTYVAPNNITLGVYLVDWLEGKKVNLKPRTIEGYRMIIETHLIPALGATLLSKLSPMAIDKYKADKLKTLSARTVDYHLTVLSQALKQAYKFKLINNNPVSLVEKPKYKSTKFMILEKEQVDVLLEAAKETKDYPIVMFGLSTGMRLGEVLGLQWGDVDLAEGTVDVNKQLQWVEGTGRVLSDPKSEYSKRIIAIPQYMVEILKDLERKSEFVFPSKTGTPFNPSNYGKRFRRLVAKAGFPGLRFHDLRHIHATYLLESGESTTSVQERLGHERASTTMDIYSHTLKSRKRSSADLMQNIFGDIAKNGIEPNTDADSEG